MKVRPVFVEVFRCEQRFCKPLVGSSILSPGTNKIKYLVPFPLVEYVAYVANQSQAFQ